MLIRDVLINGAPNLSGVNFATKNAQRYKAGKHNFD